MRTRKETIANVATDKTPKLFFPRSLVECQACQKTISDHAIMCPHCGAESRVEPWRMVEIEGTIRNTERVLIGFCLVFRFFAAVSAQILQMETGAEAVCNAGS